MAITTDRPSWTNNRRADGLSVHPADNGRWVIMPGANALPIVVCPCCELPFKTARTAIVCADALYPEQGPPDAVDPA